MFRPAGELALEPGGVVDLGLLENRRRLALTPGERFGGHAGARLERVLDVPVGARPEEQLEDVLPFGLAIRA